MAPPKEYTVRISCDTSELENACQELETLFFPETGISERIFGSLPPLAVVAADYIRNLREETRKGFYGRIKQGLCPLPAPVGYLDQGKGKPKEPDPMQSPLVKKAFELYATGKWGLNALVEKMYEVGLRNKVAIR